MDGIVSNIQRFSVHDGPGIRSTVFLKGCPLSCWWCHNPENIQPFVQELYYQERCVNCGNCDSLCNYSARESVGKRMTTEDVLKEIKKDQIFFEESGGGVTFSGGEPFMQTEFLKKLLVECKSVDIHTVVDTSGFTPWKNIESIVDYVDLFLYDIKIMDNLQHLKFTGVSNNTILDNLYRLSNLNKKIIVRIPLIRDINDNESNIENIISFIKGIQLEGIDILPYHKMGMEKYKRLNMTYKLTGDEKPKEIVMESIQNKFKSAGFKVKIGG